MGTKKIQRIASSSLDLGAPTVFYGDEVAINAPSLCSGSNGPLGDPYTRAPCAWMDQPGNPSVYGPLDTNVQAYYTTLAHLRKQHPELIGGTLPRRSTEDTQQPAAASNTMRSRARIPTKLR